MLTLTLYPNIYLSVAGPNFPNYFTVGGPTGNWGQGCVLGSVCLTYSHFVQHAATPQLDAAVEFVVLIPRAAVLGPDRFGVVPSVAVQEVLGCRLLADFE